MANDEQVLAVKCCWLTDPIWLISRRSAQTLGLSLFQVEVAELQARSFQVRDVGCGLCVPRPSPSQCNAQCNRESGVCHAQLFWQ
jgi:hypothetical protein